MANDFDPARVKKRIHDTLGKIYSEADPQLLGQYRSLMKQEVSLLKRSYFAAYLLMEADGNTSRYKRSSFNSQDNRGRDRSYNAYEDRPYRDNSYADRQRSLPMPIPEEEASRLFISVGRSRRVFPREILNLIGGALEISKDDIGTIRILDNYSFVQVRKEVADDIIRALNGRIFRGRPLSVNYARSRRDERTEGGESSEPIPGADLKMTEDSSSEQILGTDLSMTEDSSSEILEDGEEAQDDRDKQDIQGDSGDQE